MAEVKVYRPIIRNKTSNSSKYDVKFNHLFLSKEKANSFAQKEVSDDYEDTFYAYGDRDELITIYEEFTLHQEV